MIERGATEIRHEREVLKPASTVKPRATPPTDKPSTSEEARLEFEKNIVEKLDKQLKSKVKVPGWAVEIAESTPKLSTPTPSPVSVEAVKKGAEMVFDVPSQVLGDVSRQMAETSMKYKAAGRHVEGLITAIGASFVKAGQGIVEGASIILPWRFVEGLKSTVELATNPKAREELVKTVQQNPLEISRIAGQFVGAELTLGAVAKGVGKAVKRFSKPKVVEYEVAPQTADVTFRIMETPEGALKITKTEKVMGEPFKVREVKVSEAPSRTVTETLVGKSSEVIKYAEEGVKRGGEKYQKGVITTKTEVRTKTFDVTETPEVSRFFKPPEIYKTSVNIVESTVKTEKIGKLKKLRIAESKTFENVVDTRNLYTLTRAEKESILTEKGLLREGMKPFKREYSVKEVRVSEGLVPEAKTVKHAVKMKRGGLYTGESFESLTVFDENLKTRLSKFMEEVVGRESKPSKTVSTAKTGKAVKALDLEGAVEVPVEVKEFFSVEAKPRTIKVVETPKPPKIPTPTVLPLQLVEEEKAGKTRSSVKGKVETANVKLTPTTFKPSIEEALPKRAREVKPSKLEDLSVSKTLDLTKPKPVGKGKEEILPDFKGIFDFKPSEIPTGLVLTKSKEEIIPDFKLGIGGKSERKGKTGRSTSTSQGEKDKLIDFRGESGKTSKSSTSAHETSKSKSRTSSETRRTTSNKAKETSPSLQNFMLENVVEVEEVTSTSEQKSTKTSLGEGALQLISLAPAITEGASTRPPRPPTPPPVVQWRGEDIFMPLPRRKGFHKERKRRGKWLYWEIVNPIASPGDLIKF